MQRREDGTWCDARFSPGRTYRYTLLRNWGPGPWLAYVGLNPSTADHLADDPTIRRCVNFARDWGFGAMVMLNLFAVRATDPKVMLTHPHPVGPGNDDAIWFWARQVEQVVCCWGAHGVHQGRDVEVRRLLEESARRAPRVFGLTKHGHPKHPLYLSRTTQLEAWEL